MNQILVSEKLYITPELKRKKQMYKIDFFISVFLVFILSSYYIYAEYDKNKSEAEAQEILASMQFESGLVDDTKISFEDSSTIVILNSEEDATVIISTTLSKEEEERKKQEEELQALIAQNTRYTASGTPYYAIAKINIPKIGCNYSILNKCSVELLKISPCYFHGAEPNQVGNFCIAGHNYRNEKFFSKVPKLETGDLIEITDLTGTTLRYFVYDKFLVDPEEESSTDCTTQLTNGNTEITLITCTNDGANRIIVKARADR